VKARTGVNIGLAVCILAVGGFMAWRKLRKHDVVMSVQATDCKGAVAVEHTVFEDDAPVDKGTESLAPGTPGWTSPTYSHRAGAMFTVLARGACKKLVCSILIDGELAGQGGAADQVSCTAMVGG
jgi:hypothetical protein